MSYLWESHLYTETSYISSNLMRAASTGRYTQDLLPTRFVLVHCERYYFSARVPIITAPYPHTLQLVHRKLRNCIIYGLLEYSFLRHSTLHNTHRFIELRIQYILRSFVLWSTNEVSKRVYDIMIEWVLVRHRWLIMMNKFTLKKISRR